MEKEIKNNVLPEENKEKQPVSKEKENSKVSKKQPVSSAKKECAEKKECSEKQCKENEVPTPENWHVPVPRNTKQDPLWKWMAEPEQADMRIEGVKMRLKQDKYFCDVIMNLATAIGTNIFRNGCQDVYTDAYFNVQYNNVFLKRKTSKTSEKVN